MTCGMCRNIEFVKHRDGDQAAREYAVRSAQVYRKAVLAVRGRIARRAMIEAYLCSKKYLLTCQQA